MFFEIRSIVISGLILFSALGLANPPAEGEHEGRQQADGTRSVAPPFYEGVFRLVPLKVEGAVRLCPFLERSDGTQVRIKTYVDSQCKEAIDGCKDGQKCVIKGAMGSEGDALFAEQFTSFPKTAGSTTQSAETRTTESGSVFTWVSNAELRRLGVDPGRFGEAWKDPSGMIWGDMAKKGDGSRRFMYQRDAEAYCKSIGAELPSGYFEELNGKRGFPNRDSDFVRLRKYMGAKSLDKYGAPDGYKAQVLPNLTHTENGWIQSRYFWSSSDHPYHSVYAFHFMGHDGEVDYSGHYIPGVSVRCVVAGR